jgi:hypothetical protein
MIPIKIDQLISVELSEHITSEITLMSERNYQEDLMIPGAYSCYAPIVGETLLKTLKPQIEFILKKELNCSYSYCRIYNKGAELKPHVDREGVEYTVTLCLDFDKSWPICFFGHECIDLDVGDAVLFTGSKYEHFRMGPYKGSKYVVLMLMYVDKNGKWKDNVYDGKPIIIDTDDYQYTYW